jgi:hypothetical protein
MGNRESPNAILCTLRDVILKLKKTSEAMNLKPGKQR